MVQGQFTNKMLADEIDRGPPEEMRLAFDVGPPSSSLLPCPIVTIPDLQRLLQHSARKKKCSQKLCENYNSAVLEILLQQPLMKKYTLNGGNFKLIIWGQTSGEKIEEVEGFYYCLSNKTSLMLGDITQFPSAVFHGTHLTFGEQMYIIVQPILFLFSSIIFFFFFTFWFLCFLNLLVYNFSTFLIQCSVLK